MSKTVGVKDPTPQICNLPLAIGRPGESGCGESSAKAIASKLEIEGLHGELNRVLKPPERFDNGQASNERAFPTGVRTAFWPRGAYVCLTEENLLKVVTFDFSAAKRREISGPIVLEMPRHRMRPTGNQLWRRNVDRKRIHVRSVEQNRYAVTTVGKFPGDGRDVAFGKFHWSGAAEGYDGV